MITPGERASRNAERAARERAEQLRLFVEHAPAAVAMLDRDMRYLSVSRRWLSDYRVEGGDILGRSHYELFPELPARWKAVHDRCLAGAVEKGDEEAFPRTDGSIDWVRWEIHPWRDADGDIGGIMLFSEVITERHRAIEALREREAEARRARARALRLVEISVGLMAETSAEVLAQRIVDAAREIVDGSAAVLGRRDGDGLGVDAASGAAPLSSEPDGELLDVIEAHETVRRGTLLGGRLLTHHGSTRAFIVVTAAHDFTEDDQAILRELTMVASLTAQDLEARLRLLEADHNKDQFLAMLSHELRNPLAPIRSSLHVLARAAPGGEQAQRAQAVIARQVDHLTRLVDDLLDATRVSQGKIQLVREPLDLRALLELVIVDHRPAFLAADVALDAALGEQPTAVRADRTRLAQAVGNLVHNAAKFTPAGGRTTLSLERDEARREAVVRVSDTGVGIEPELIPQLFVPFMQAPRTLDRSQGGLGLGLSLVKRLIEMHGGSVTARSAGSGQGAEITMRLPLDESGSRAPITAPDAPRAPVRRRVLVIDDNLDAAESLQAALELEGHEVRVAGDGPEGLFVAREERPEVILCDIGLPGMDGYEVARVVRADEALGRTFLVALTGYARPEDQALALAAGFDHHLAKPPHLEQIAEMLATLRGPDAPRAR